MSDNQRYVGHLVTGNVFGQIVGATDTGLYIVGPYDLRIVNSLDDLEQPHCATCTCWERDEASRARLV
jgi:hypothetical protein